MRKNEPLLIDRQRAAYLLDVSVRQIDRLIAQGDLATREVGRKQLLIYDSLKQFCNGGGRPKAVHANA